MSPRTATPVLAAVCPLLAVLFWPSVAAAHTGLASSDPEAGSLSTGPVETIELTFNRGITPVVENFRLLDAAGGGVSIAEVAHPSPERVTVVPDEPLAGGEFGLAWSVRAGDGHPVEDNLTFVAGVAAPPPEVAAAAGAAEVEAPPVVADDEPPANSTPAAESDTAGVAAPAESTALAEALDGGEPDTALAEAIAWAGRALMYLGVLVAVGGLIYLMWVHQGPVRETRLMVHWVRRAAVVVAAATVVEGVAQLAVFHDGSFWSLTGAANYGHVLGNQFGIGLLIRLAGSLAILLGLQMSLRWSANDERLASRRSQQEVSDTSSERSFAHVRGGDVEVEMLDAGTAALSGASSGAVAVDEAVVRTTVARVKMADSTLAVLGAAAVLTSFLFIGHTASEGSRVLTAITDVIHVGAGAAWAGGAILLARTLWVRHREGRPAGAAVLVGRFSSVATVALIAVSIAGVALTVIVLPSISAIWQTSFGLILLAKVAVVAAIAAAGAYNHHRLVPVLEESPNDPTARRQLRWSVTGEAIGFLVIIGLTAALVASGAAV